MVLLPWPGAQCSAARWSSARISAQTPEFPEQLWGTQTEGNDTVEKISEDEVSRGAAAVVLMSTQKILSTHLHLQHTQT